MSKKILKKKDLDEKNISFKTTFKQTTDDRSHKTRSLPSTSSSVLLHDTKTNEFILGRNKNGRYTTLGGSKNKGENCENCAVRELSLKSKGLIKIELEVLYELKRIDIIDKLTKCIHKCFIYQSTFVFESKTFDEIDVKSNQNYNPLIALERLNVAEIKKYFIDENKSKSKKNFKKPEMIFTTVGVELTINEVKYIFEKDLVEILTQVFNQNIL